MSSSRLFNKKRAAVNGPSTSDLPPLTQLQNAKDYLQEKNIPNMFQGLIAAMMMEKPTDPIQYLDTTLEEVKRKGPENINWETFVYDKHPYRDPIRMEMLAGEKSVKSDKKVGQEVIPNYTPDVFSLTEPDEDDE